MKTFHTVAVLSTMFPTSVVSFVSFKAHSKTPLSTMHMSSEVDTITVPEPDAIEAVPPQPIMSQSMPFMERSAILNGELAGDVGFDPLGFAKSKADLWNYREAEIKHARLAMLAAAGWPVSEIFDKKIADVFGLDPLLDSSDRVPSLLNGGLGKVSPFYWIGCIGIAAAIDLYGVTRRSREGYIPGDYGFDPLGLYPKSEEDKKNMQLAEIKNGRLAMIAVFAFAIQEFVSNQGVVNETPFFFFPLMQTLHEYANSGYIN